MGQTDIRSLAAELADRVLTADPWLGTTLGMSEYDALVPDNSRGAEDAHLADLADVQSRAATLKPATAAERVTLAVILETCLSGRLAIEMQASDHTVTALPIDGPPALLALTAITSLTDGRSAADYLTRVRSSIRWLDTGSQRLFDGGARGRVPVGSLVDQAIQWCERTLAEPIPAPLVPAAPAGWDGAGTWRADLEDVIGQEVVPAIGRWHDVLIALRPTCRSDDRAGLCALPDGERDYEHAIRMHTTLPLTADELHRTGLTALERLGEQARELGAGLGITSLSDVLDAARRSGADINPQDALASARAAVRRAEDRAPDMMPQPLPGRCAVEPMPPTVAASGMAPHYSPPKRDGSKPGTYWFNTVRATAGAGWDLEAVAFHETVPGHHSQLARQQRLTGLPLLQQLIITAHAEGWGLYAERLAGEFGLYSGVQAQIGAVATELFRAARLVVDTGLHAFGWSRQRATEFMVDQVPLPAAFLADEVVRYIAWPGQALAYLTGQQEILRLREDASRRLADRFDLRAFNAAVLDSGSLPLPVLGAAVDSWITTF